MSHSRLMRTTLRHTRRRGRGWMACYDCLVCSNSSMSYWMPWWTMSEPDGRGSTRTLRDRMDCRAWLGLSTPMTCGRA